jgi:RNA recognition motif-containing protein
MSFTTTTEALETLFAKVGKVTSVRIIQNYQGKSKGFGYVEFDTVANANAALKFNGQEVDGRELKVDISTQRPYAPTEGSTEKPRRQKTERKPRVQNKRKASREPREKKERKQEPRIEVPREESTTLFVGNMSWSTKEETL